MSILPAMQRAALRVAGVRPITFFGSQGQIEVEMCDLVNEVGHDIMRHHDWQGLTKIHEINADGIAKNYPLPDDYDRMVLVSDIINSPHWFWGYYHPESITEFMFLRESGFTAWPGVWMMLENQIQFAPAPSGTAKFPYVSKNFAIDGGSGAPKPEFDHDNDNFFTDNELLTLGLVWRWRDQKGLDATGDQESFERALERVAVRDKGSRVIRRSRRPYLAGVYPAWPYPLGQ